MAFEAFTATFEVNGWQVEGERDFQSRRRHNQWMTWRVFKLDDKGYLAQSLKNQHGDLKFTSKTAAFAAAKSLSPSIHTHPRYKE